MNELYQVNGTTYTLAQIEEIAMKAIQEGTHTMTEAILGQIKAEAFERGIKTALYELREVYGEGIEDTDIWAEYMDEEEAE